jgi:hypothetical protein
LGGCTIVYTCRYIERGREREGKSCILRELLSKEEEEETEEEKNQSCCIYFFDDEET